MNKRVWTVREGAKAVGHWLIAATLCGAILLGLAGSAAAFDVQRDKAGKALRFAPRSVAVYLRPAGLPSGLKLQALQAAVEAAMQAWVSVPAAQSPLVLSGLAVAPTGYDVDIAFESDFTVKDGEVLAKTLRFADPTGQLARVEIRLNARDVQWTGGPLSGSAQVKADLQGVLTHHLGHALGLAHSRDPGSTMYFYGTSTALRTLSVDDQKGMRMLWPAGAAPIGVGRVCDACEGDVDCAAGHCLVWPDGKRGCSPPCQSHDDCPIGYSCGVWSGGTGCLPSDGACQPDAADVGLGGACASDLACKKGYCMPAAPVGFCTSTCGGCASPGQCFTTNIGNLCLIRGDRKDGDSCWVPGDCASFVCAPTLEGGGRCTRQCTAGCPSKWRCDEDGLCVPESSPQALATGWPCRSGFDCTSGYCLQTPGGRFDQTCTLPCTGPSDCPEGTGCTQSGTDSWCLPSPLLAASVGSPCPASGACGAGLVCDVGPLPGWPACRQACDPFADSPGCASAQYCVFTGVSGSGVEGACRPAIGGKRPMGASCTAAEPCRDDLVCVAEGSGAATCRRDCDVLTGGCSAGEQCGALASGGRGVCVPTGQELPPGGLPEIAATPELHDNYAAVNMNLPKVVAASAWKGVTAEEPPADTGCGAGLPRGSGSSLPMLMAAWGYGVWRGRRRSGAPAG